MISCKFTRIFFIWRLLLQRVLVNSDIMKFLSIQKINFKYFPAFIKFNLISLKICGKTRSEKCYISIKTFYNFWNYVYREISIFRSETVCWHDMTICFKFGKMNINCAMFKTNLSLIFLIKMVKFYLTILFAQRLIKIILIVLLDVPFKQTLFVHFLKKGFTWYAKFYQKKLKFGIG